MRKGIDMRMSRLAVAVVIIGFLTLLCSGGLAAEGEKKAGQGFDPAAMAKMWEEFAKLGPEHENLKHMVGEWKTEVKDYWANPKEPRVFEGKAVFTLLMGGRYLQERFESEHEGKPYEGLAIHGYDKAKKKYVTVWMDNMSTGFLISEGEFDRATGMVTFVGESETPMGKMKARAVVDPVDADKVVFTTYMTMPGAAETKGVEITYTRK